jgi:hypothetical protein
MTNEERLNRIKDAEIMDKNLFKLNKINAQNSFFGKYTVVLVILMLIVDIFIMTKFGFMPGIIQLIMTIGLLVSCWLSFFELRWTKFLYIAISIIIISAPNNGGGYVNALAAPCIFFGIKMIFNHRELMQLKLKPGYPYFNERYYPTEYDPDLPSSENEQDFMDSLTRNTIVGKHEPKVPQKKFHYTPMKLENIDEDSLPKTQEELNGNFYIKAEGLPSIEEINLSAEEIAEVNSCDQVTLLPENIDELAFLSDNSTISESDEEIQKCKNKFLKPPDKLPPINEITLGEEYTIEEYSAYNNYIEFYDDDKK